MAETRWTQPQQNAISARGGSVLVSAAAGSGKTAVLVERVVQMLCDEFSPVDIDRMLVVTFSRAAAAEMKQRLGIRLVERIAKQPDDLHLQRQQALLGKAKICTVDAFCIDLVRQNFQYLEVAPDFTVMDESELLLLKTACVNDCVAWFYENEPGTQFTELIELLSTGRDDRQLPEIILKIYTFSRSHPFPEQWLDDKLALYRTGLPAARSIWGQSILRRTKDDLAYCVGLLRRALSVIDDDEALQKAYMPAFCSDLTQIERCQAAVETGDWDGAVIALRAVRFDRLGTLRGDCPEKVRVQSIRDQVKRIIKVLAEKMMNASEAQFQEDIANLEPKIELLFRMVKDFSRRLWNEKKRRKRLDFSDLEHLALQLLVQQTPNGPQPTREAVALSEQYDYILVDEYQDTNEVQDLLFTCISREQTNLFMVGDVKQSIYAFRQAMPEIFMAKKARFFPYEVGQYPAKIALDTNFRSRKEVVGAVNSIFERIMSLTLGNIDYDAQESLKYGASYMEADHVQPELLLIDAQKDSGTDAQVQEATAIARRILAMMDNGDTVEEKGRCRPMRLKDICILMRSPKKRAAGLVKILAEYGISSAWDDNGGFLDTREIASVVSFLCALDNPLLDIELAAAMMSPLFGFSANDLARVRLVERGVPLFSALTQAAQNGDEKSAAFLQVFHAMRVQAAVLPVDRLLLQIYTTTDAMAIFRAMPMGEGRCANLQLLLEYAASYHAVGYKQLSGFVGFLQRLMEKEGDLPAAGNTGTSADMVRIMSIHRSKGLEFPVVFLADTARQFNLQDLRQTTLLHSRYGFACVRREPDTKKQYATIPMQSIRIETERSMLSEEMRILYVAMTRAREKLVITGAVKNDLAKLLTKLYAECPDARLPSSRLSDCSCYLEWLLMTLLHYPSGEPLRQVCGLRDVPLFPETVSWAVRVISPESEQIEEMVEEDHAIPPDVQLLEQLHTLAGWTYVHERETRIPTKFAVSDVVKGERDVQYRFQTRPRFLTEQKLTQAEQGDAMHKFMQFADYQAAYNDLDTEIRRMRDRQFLSSMEAESLQKERLFRFFHSAFAQRIFQSADVRRELRFMAECGQDVLGEDFAEMGDSKVVLQGVADCVFIENSYAIIVDYKTDRVASADELRERYAKQLVLYREILSEQIEYPVGACYLYSFHLNTEVKIR